MNRAYDEDLFEKTKMTFGEHLEELRRCLWRAVLGIAIGMGIGLYFGDVLVDYIQTPLRDALHAYHNKRGQERLKDYARERYGDETKIPAEAVARLKEGLLFEYFYWDPAAIRDELTLDGEKKTVAQSPNDQSPNDVKADDLRPLTPILLWRKTRDDPRTVLTSLSAPEAFMIWLKAGFVFGAMVASPWVFFQIWNFVAAGLYPHEKKYVYMFLPFSLTLFFAGAALAFYVVFGFVLEFLFKFNASMGIEPDARISEWLSFVIFMPLGFGISFQLPLVMLFLERIGVFTIESYVSKWRIAVLVIAFLSMILSPGGDPYSMLAMFTSLTCLFFLGIVLCKYMKRAANPFAVALPSERS
ncbi:MAG: twin-arginine translocase subunit TatC [Pirellulales bacterium]